MICENMVGRKLVNSDMLKRVLGFYAPEKLSLRTLRDVFQHFSAIACHELFNQTTPFNTECVYFEYEEKMWCATIDCRYANYGGDRVFFTNISFPNPGVL